jgi:hypothetical protein
MLQLVSFAEKKLFFNGLSELHQEENHDAVERFVSTGRAGL